MNVHDVLIMKVLYAYNIDRLVTIDESYNVKMAKMIKDIENRYPLLSVFNCAFNDGDLTTEDYKYMGEYLG